MTVCSTDCLYHYLLGATVDARVTSILERGLVPLSAMPESERWQSIEHARPDFYRQLYVEFAQPVIQRPYLHSGVFFTPIDFRRMEGTILTKRTRIKVPITAIDPDCAALTYVLDGKRVMLSLTDGNLRETARLWTDAMVRAWFGRDQTKLFLYVPQASVYQPEGILVQADWVEVAEGE